MLFIYLNKDRLMTVSLDGLHIMDRCDYHSHVSAQFGVFLPLKTSQTCRHMRNGEYNLILNVL